LPDRGTLEPLAPAHHEAAARLLADAFIDDPGWVSVGPRRRPARWRYINRVCLGTIRVGERWCGPSWCITEGGEPVAVLTGCAPGIWPPPELRTLAMLSPGPLIAGPAVLIRSLRAELIFERRHPGYEHFLVWMFAVSPARQRAGLGRRLMSEALARADAEQVPAYLSTANPDNLPYYRSHGYDVIGEDVIPGGARAWYMERPPDAKRRRPRCT
jgi:GNAT superfamily N-acetyltransferase